MIFCDNSDLYISLYIDDQLGQNDKEEFLKHIEECPQCAQKLKEESYFKQLVNDEAAIELPEDFSSSLHSRLIEVSKKDYNNKNRLLFFNKKLMAAFSTAAMVVISLLAFKLLPGMWPGMDKAGYNESAASQAAAVTADKQLSQDSTMARNADNRAANSSDVSKEKGVAADSTQDQAAKKEAAARSGVSNSKLKSVVETSGMEDFKVKASIKSDSQESSKSLNVAENAESSTAGTDKADSEKTVTFAKSGSADAETQHYYTNYVELDLTGSASETKMEELKKFMSEQGAIEQGAGLMNGFAANYKGIAAYIDYVIPLNKYVSLKSEALLKYKLELKAKTDIIKTDVTEKYNNLENQKKDIENKISEALNKGQDTTALEAEKSTLIKQMDNLVAENGMITVRIFLAEK